MRSVINTAVLAMAASTLTSAAPVVNPQPNIQQLPFSDGFPTPKADQLTNIQKGAFGELSNLPPPAGVQPDTATSIQLVALNELYESYYFGNVYNQLNNKTFMRTMNKLDVTPAQLRAGIESIFKVEELHAINAEKALQNVVKTDPIFPCEFIFPVDDIYSAIVEANRFTDAVTGVLGDIVVKAGKAGDAGFTQGVVASAVDEGEQNGGFRTWLHNRAQSQPFHTFGSRVFGYSLLQDVIVSGTCGKNTKKIDLQVLQPLTVADPSAKSQDLTFKFSTLPVRVDKFNGPNKVNSLVAQNNKYKGSQCPGLFVTYISGASIISEPVKKCNFASTSQVTAYFPQAENDMFGSVIAVITNGQNFTSVDDVIKANVFGFTVMEVQEGKQF